MAGVEDHVAGAAVVMRLHRLKTCRACLVDLKFALINHHWLVFWPSVGPPTILDNVAQRTRVDNEASA